MTPSRRIALYPPLFALAILFILLPGCGGGGGPTGTVPDTGDEVVIEGQVDLPAGVSLAPESAALTLGAETVDLDAGGAFSAALRDGSPQLALLTGPDGDPLLMSWLGETRTAISVRSTAEALVYFGLGVWALPPDGAGRIIELLADPATDLAALESAIATQLAANPDGFPGENAAVKAALIQTLETFYAKAEERSDATGERGLLIEPADEQSGIACLNLGGVNKFTLKNSYRRRALTLIKKISWFDAEGEEHFFDTTPPQTFEIPPVAGFAGVIGTIGSAVTGDIAYTPVTMPAVQLRNHTGANYTKYRVVTGGPGVVDPMMDIYVSDDEQDDIDWVCLKGVVWDFFVPLLMNALATANELGGLGEALSVEDEVSGALLEVLNYIVVNVPQIYAYAADGHYQLAVTECYNGISTTGGFRTVIYDLIRAMMEKLGVAAGDIAPALERVDRFLQIVGWIDLVGNYMDSAVVFAHMAASDHIDEWDILVTDPAITLTASQTSIHVADRVDSLTVNIDDDTGDGLPDGTAYVYRWSCDGVAGRLTNPMHPDDASNAFETSSPKVLYRADTGVAASELIRVQVLTRAGTTLTYIGCDSTAVDVRERTVTVTPSEATLAPEDEQTFELDLEPQFTVAITDSVHFDWTNTADAGDLYSEDGDVAPFTTQATTTRYEAGEEVGEDTLTLTAYRVFPDGVETAFASLTVPVRVEDFGIILVAHPDTVAPDGLASADIMATVRLWAPGDTDQPTGDPVAGRTVTFSTDLGDLAGDNPATTNAGGNALVAISSSENGTATIVAECEGVEETVTVAFERRVHLAPEILHVASDSTRTLTASVNPDFAAGADVIYRWTCDEAFGTLTGPGGERPPFDSALPTADYCGGGEAGDETVTVEVLHAAVPGDYQSVGTAVCDVDIGGVGMILDAYPPRIFADGVMEGTIEVTLRNWDEEDLDIPTGDPLAGESVLLSVTLGDIVGDNPVLTDADGRAVFRVTGENVGTAQIAAEHERASASGEVTFVAPGSAILLVRTSATQLGIYVAWAEVYGATSYTMTWDAGGDPSFGPGGLCAPGPLSYDTGSATTAGDEWQVPEHELAGYKCFYHWTIGGGSGGDFGDWPARVYASYAHYEFTVAPNFE